ncbi:TIGR04438 family Trp-rich protein [Variovorax sp. VNK109]|uniref:TIGR04438 family Trp-rich protein n=1 Tax=Variovorax sp. VNK109 TaxID=3400919 RepID=UPI003C0385EB
MLFLVIGIVFIVLKYMELTFVATWSWWIILSPFLLAVAWWHWSDASGRTKRRAMEKMENRKKDRLQKQRDALKGFKSRD